MNISASGIPSLRNGTFVLPRRDLEPLRRFRRPHTYLPPEIYTVRPTASGSSGSDIEAKSDHIVVISAPGAPPDVTGVRRTDTRWVEPDGRIAKLRGGA